MDSFGFCCLNLFELVSFFWLFLIDLECVGLCWAVLVVMNCSNCFMLYLVTLVFQSCFVGCVSYTFSLRQVHFGRFTRFSCGFLSCKSDFSQQSSSCV